MTRICEHNDKLHFVLVFEVRLRSEILVVVSQFSILNVAKRFVQDVDCKQNHFVSTLYDVF